jgi:hypothetical protein
MREKASRRNRHGFRRQLLRANNVGFATVRHPLDRAAGEHTRQPAPRLGRSRVDLDSDGVPFTALAKREGVSPSYFTRLVRLSYLAPDITQAILDGRQPPDLTADKLLAHSRLPLAWHEQRTVLGFSEPDPRSTPNRNRHVPAKPLTC